MLYLNFTDAKLTNFDIHTTPNGNLIFLGSSPESEYKDKRVFYVLNKNGRGYFTDQITNEENAISIFEDLSSSINYGNLFSIRIDNKEYIWIISENSKIEIYDLDAHLKYEYNASQIFESYSYTQHMSACLEIDNNNYLLGLSGFYEGMSILVIYQLNFSYNNNEILPRIIEIKYRSVNSKDVSCYKTVLNYIICFYQNSFYYYEAVAFDQNLNYVTYIDILNEPINKEYFFKCAHFYEEVGIFGYFNSEKNFTFKFKLLQNDTFVNYYTQRETLVLNLPLLFTNSENSDIIKLDDKKICFSSNGYISLYIVIINDYNEGNIKIRYYEINMAILYSYGFRGLLKMSLYNNNFIALGSSYNQIKTINGELEESSSLLLLSYPNSKDFDVDITDYFTAGQNIIIDLNSKCNIDNNIFGLIPIGVKIINFDEVFRLLSTKDYRTINIGESIDNDENITLNISNFVNFPTIGKIEYAMIITEPEYDIYNRYVNKYEYDGAGIDDENDGYFIRKNYTGKYSYCSIKLNSSELTNHCQVPNCKLCFISNLTKCIYCEYGFIISENDGVSCIVPNSLTTLIETTILETTIIETTNIYTTFIYNTIMGTTIIETTLPETTIIESSIPKTFFLENPSTFKEQDTNNIETTNIETNQIESTFLSNPNNDLNPKTTIILNDNDSITSIITNNNINNKLNCSNDEIMNNKCINGNININQIDEIKTELLKNNNSNILIKSENITIQITTSEEQKKDIPEVSSIDLGECENLLKDHYNISRDESLIIFKIDIKTEDLSSTYVKYEIYDPKKEKKLKLDICKDAPISISVPVILDKNLD